MKKVRIGCLGLLGIIVLLFAVPYVFPIATYDDSISGPFGNSQMLDLDGTMIHFREWMPDDKVRANVLLVHGFCGSTYNWIETVPALTAAGYRVLAIDIPPFGYSDRFPESGHGLSARSDYAWGAIDAATSEDSSKWWLVGHSMGGGIIEAMAQLEPDRTAGLVFVDGGGMGAGPGASGGILISTARALMGFGPVRRWVEVYAKHVAFQEDNIRELCISAAGEPPTEDILQNYLSALRVPQTASAILDMFREGRTDLTLDPSQVTQPTLILWGDKDTWVPLKRGEKLHESIPHSEMVIIEGAHHMPMETHPEELNAAMVGFLNKYHGKLATPTDSP